MDIQVKTLEHARDIAKRIRAHNPTAATEYMLGFSRRNMIELAAQREVRGWSFKEIEDNAIQVDKGGG
jgi:hypothetical protein